MEATISAVYRTISRLGLKISPAEAAWFHGLPRPRNTPRTFLSVGSDRVIVRDTLKYLGVTFDSRLDFIAHFSSLAPRVERTAVYLSRLLPNIGGPSTKIRRLYTNVIRSMIMYGAPVWAKFLNKKKPSDLHPSAATDGR